MNTLFIFMTTPHNQSQYWALTGSQGLHRGNALSVSLVTQAKQQLTQLIGGYTRSGLNDGQVVNTKPAKQVAKLALVKVMLVNHGINLRIHNLSLSDLIAKSLVKLTCVLEVPKSVYFWNAQTALGGRYE
ncbi:hypothetical protein NDQ71_00905 [Pseudoalteromonas sp. KG3]|uniref:hypothetical protein n=1 Tax=Pseudoalteromonas sp. KG3 TaxID=2951137 RepID=UPI00265810C9|nr:hypothetical protein [Pseudoalteromonas sp. KG3]WKD23693.1 hypothetical protein NDQ71_00905 [Pseudoalteromonas sp. KG3]